MGLSLVSITFVVVFACLAGMLWLIFSNVKLNAKETRKSASAQGKVLEPDNRARFLKTLTGVYHSLNLKSIMSTVTENLFYATQASINVFTKLGIRKDISIVPDETMNAQPTMGFVVADGKNNMTVDLTYCNYSEQYIDNVTEQVLYQKQIPDAVYTMEVIKSDCLERQDTHYCSNCGTPMDIQGDFFNCPHCGAHYTTESYNWIVSNVSVQNRKNDNRIQKMFLFVLLAMLGLAFIGDFIGGTIFTAASLTLNIAVALVVALYIITAIQKLAWYKKIAKNDPHFSKMVFQKRLTYLLKQYYFAKDFQLSSIESFMVPALYEQLKQGHQYDNFYLIDLDILKTEVSNYYVENGKQVVELKVRVEEVSLNEQKKLKKKKKDLLFSVCRDASLRTEVVQNAETIVCENCGATVNLTADSKCKRCGTKYDLSKYDWILYKIG